MPTLRRRRQMAVEMTQASWLQSMLAPPILVADQLAPFLDRRWVSVACAHAQELQKDLIKLESTARLRQEVSRPPGPDVAAGHGHRPEQAGAAVADNRSSDGVSAPRIPPASWGTADVKEPIAAVAAGWCDAGADSIGAASAERELRAGADAPTHPAETATPQPGKRRSFRPVVSVKRALERLRARSVTPPAGEDGGAVAHALQLPAHPAAAAGASPCTTAGAAAMSLNPPSSDPGPLQRGPRPPPATPGVQSEPAKGPCQHERLDATVGSERGAALPERTHVSDTPARTADSSPRRHGASVRPLEEHTATLTA